jgi:hypothetical protein
LRIEIITWIDKEDKTQGSKVDVKPLDPKTGIFTHNFSFTYNIRFRDSNNKWIENDPYAWIDTLISFLDAFIRRKCLLGDITKIDYYSGTNQIWRKAYFHFEVIPQLV